MLSYIKRKSLIFLILMAFSAGSFVSAQENSQKKGPTWLYRLASEQFNAGEYAYCLRTLDTWFEQEQVLPENLRENARFMYAASSYELNRMESSLLLKEFIGEFPLSVQASRAYYMLGINAMNARQYQDALAFFLSCRSKDFSKKEEAGYRFYLAFTYLQLDELDQARALFEGLLQEDQRYVSASTYYLAFIDYRQGRTEQALEGFGKIAAHPEYERIVPFYIMQLYFDQGKNKEMLEIAEKLLQEDPNESERIELYRLSAAGYYELNDHALSQEYYGKYLRYNPELLRSDAYRIGINHYVAKEYEQAAKYFLQVSQEGDALAQNAEYHLGLCYLQQQKFDQARMSFEQASLSDQDKEVKESALYNYALLCYQTSFSPFNEQVRAFERILTEFPNSRYADRVYGHLVDAFLSTKNYQASFDVLNKIADPGKDLLETKSKLLFLMGMDRFNNAAYGEALTYFNSSIQLSTQLRLEAPETYFWRGETHYRLENLRAASNDYLRFLNSPNASNYKAWQLAHYNLGYSYYNLKQYPEALNWFLKYSQFKEIRNDNTYPDVLNRIGDCYFHARNYDRAEEYYNMSDKLSETGNDYAVFQRGFSMGLQKRHEEKARLFAGFEERFPLSDYLDDALYEQGRAYIALNRPAEALPVFEKLMQKFPNNILARKAGIQIGLLEYNRNNTEAAIAAYKKVINEYPGSQEAQTALNDLKMIYVAVNRVPEYLNYVDNLGSGVRIERSEKDSLSYLAAERLMVDGKNQEAIKGFQDYINAYPQGMFRTEAYFHAGNLLLLSNETSRALPYFQEVIKQTGHRFVPEALVVLAEHEYKQKEYARALEHYQSLDVLAEDRSVRIGTRSGILRCLYALGRNESIPASADKLLAEENLSPSLQREALFRKTIALMELNRTDEALSDLQRLAEESQTAFGAEARFRLAEYWFNKNDLKKAEEIAQSFLRDGTSQSYWLARCFVLLSDIYIQRKDYFQARQYLMSLKENYRAEDEIAGMIQTRLDNIAQLSKE
ncbi:MAG TPA: tetratricopeptide repeat protein [Bacteroidales bacterium]|nr:tetratricopeptide repeat protein [Bacteroidales bacterium]